MTSLRFLVLSRSTLNASGWVGWLASSDRNFSAPRNDQVRHASPGSGGRGGVAEGMHDAVGTTNTTFARTYAHVSPLFFPGRFNATFDFVCCLRAVSTSPWLIS